MELYTNARFISCEKENRIYTAMAVKGGHIVWLGDESSIPPRYGKAKRVDLGGATVTPAFGDTHMHFGSLCVFENTFYLMDVKDFAEAKAAVRRYADSHRKNKVLMGYGCTANTVAEHRLPEKRDLDDWTERPLMVMKYDGHAAVCNSAMLALLSDKVKSDPGCNTETGWLYQSAFYNGVNEATAYIPTMDIIRGLSGGAEYLASVGIGLVHTVEGVGFANDLDIDMIKILAPGLPQAFRIFFQTMDLKAVKKARLQARRRLLQACPRRLLRLRGRGAQGAVRERSEQLRRFELSAGARERVRHRRKPRGLADNHARHRRCGGGAVHNGI